MSIMGKTDKTPIGEINVTPLVDVMLVLLVVFIVTAPLLTVQSLTVQLPKAQAVEQKQDPSKVNLHITAQGELVYRDTPVTEAQLIDSLREAAKNDDFRLQVAVDKTVPYERVAQVMAAAQAAGVARLNFVTEKRR